MPSSDVVQLLEPATTVAESRISPPTATTPGMPFLIAAMRAGARRGLGVDIDPDLAEVAYAAVKSAGLQEKVEVRWGNALAVDMSNATVVFLFMGEPFNLVMRPLLWKQLPLGARVVSNDFAMGDWQPDRTYTLYLWTITQDVKARAGRR